MELDPHPEVVPVGGRVDFNATIRELGGKLYRDQRVRWSVNGTEGGTPEVGGITKAGVYTAPGRLPASSTKVTVRAQSAVSAAVVQEVSFLLEELTVTPKTVEGQQPGQRFPLRIEAHLSDGTTEDITRFDTTKVVAPHPPVVGVDPGAPSTLVLGGGAGRSLVSVEDHRWDPVPATRVAVTNLTTFRLVLQPEGTVRSVTPGERSSLRVGVIPDRGGQAGSFLDISRSPFLSVRASDALGAVTSFDTPEPPSNKDDLVAWWDRANGQLVFGGKPGTTSFIFTEGKSGQTATLSVQLVDLTVEVTPYATWWEPIKETPTLIFTPRLDVPPNETVHLNIVLKDAEGQLTVDELNELLQDKTVVAESVTGKGLMRGAGEIFIFEPGQPPVPLRDPAPPSLGPRADLPVSLVQDFDPFTGAPVQVLGTGVLYSPGGPGEQPVKLSIPGTTAEPVTVPVKGRFPRLSLQMQHIVTGLRDTEVYPGPKVLFVTGVYDPGLGIRKSAEAASGFTLELAGTGPTGAIGSTDWIALGQTTVGPGHTLSPLYENQAPPRIPDPNLDNARFLVAMTKAGAWRLTLKAKGYDQALSDPVVFPIVERALKVDMPGNVQQLYPAAGPTKLTLHLRKPLKKLDDYGNPVPQARLQLNVGGYIPTQEAPEYSSADYFSGTNVTYADGVDYQGGAKEVKILCDPKDESRGKAVVAMGGLADPTSDLTLDVTTKVASPLHPRCHLFYYFGYWDDTLYKDLAFVHTSLDDDNPSASRAYFPIVPPKLQVIPSLLLLTSPDVGKARLERKIQIGGQSVLDAFTGGASVAADSLHFEDKEGQRLAWLTVKSVKSLNEFSLEAALEIDTGHRGFALGDYTGHLALGTVRTTFDLPIARLILSGPEEGDKDPILPIPLNGKWQGQERQGVMPFEARLTGAHARTVVHLATSPDAEGIGFGRLCTRGAYPSPVTQCTITSQDTYLFFDTTQEAAGALQARDKVTVPLFGDLTDKTSPQPTRDPSGNLSKEVPDGVPDNVSKKENSEAIVLKGAADGMGDLILFKTTRFNFVTELVGKPEARTVERGRSSLRTGPLNLGVGHDPKAASDTFTSSPNFSSYYEALQALSWWEDYPSKKANRGPDASDRDIFPHVDNMHQFTGDSGMLDMYWLQLTGKDKEGNPQDRRVGNDGRVRDFFRENHPGGSPDATIISKGEKRWKPFGVQLDGVCFDAGVGFDYPPNAPDLLVSSSGYETSRGLLKGEGGMSGGLVDPQTGEFTVVARTPGVDFPGLNCGYQVDGRPEGLGDDDIEDVLVNTFKWQGEGPKVTPYLDSPHPFRVTTFGEAGMFREDKQIRTAMHIGGKNAAFRIATNPLGDDGKPLVEARIRAILDLLPSSLYASPGEITLTARPDAMARAYAAGTHIAISTGTAMATAAVMAVTGGVGGVGMAALVSGGVAFTFQAADEAGGGMAYYLGTGGSGKVGASAVSTTTSTALQRIGERGLAENSVKPQTFKITGADISSAGAGFLTGILASIINDEIDETDYYDDVDMGHAEAYVAEQLGLIVPPDAPVDDKACGSGAGPSSGVRTMWATNFRAYRLDAKNPSALAKKVETGTYAEDYYQLVQPAPGRQRVLMAPGDTLSPKQVDPRRHPQVQGGPSSIANFALCVGGESATSIPFFHTVSVSAQRNTEEATARVRIDRTGPITLNLIGIEVLEARP